MNDIVFQKKLFSSAKKTSKFDRYGEFCMDSIHIIFACFLFVVLMQAFKTTTIGSDLSVYDDFKSILVDNSAKGSSAIGLNSWLGKLILGATTVFVSIGAIGGISIRTVTATSSVIFLCSPKFFIKVHNYRVKLNMKKKNSGNNPQAQGINKLVNIGGATGTLIALFAIAFFDFYELSDFDFGGKMDAEGNMTPVVDYSVVAGLNFWTYIKENVLVFSVSMVLLGALFVGRHEQLLYKISEAGFIVIEKMLSFDVEGKVSSIVGMSTDYKFIFNGEETESHNKEKIAKFIYNKIQNHYYKNIDDNAKQVLGQYIYNMIESNEINKVIENNSNLIPNGWKNSKLNCQISYTAQIPSSIEKEDGKGSDDGNYINEDIIFVKSSNIFKGHSVLEQFLINDNGGFLIRIYGDTSQEEIAKANSFDEETSKPTEAIK